MMSELATTDFSVVNVSLLCYHEVQERPLLAVQELLLETNLGLE